MSAAAPAPLMLLLAGVLVLVIAIRTGSPNPTTARAGRVRTVLPGQVLISAPIGRRALPALIGAAFGMVLVPYAGFPAIGLAAVLAVMGWLTPRLLAERRQSTDRAMALRQIRLAVALLRAQIAMGLGLEPALRNLATSPLIGSSLGTRLRAVLAAFGLGRSVEQALAQLGQELDSVEIQILARSITQARRLGVGLEETLARSEFEFVAAHERRVAAAAERAQLRSQLLIVGCFLPAFLAMVLIPLFIGMLQGLAG